MLTFVADYFPFTFGKDCPRSLRTGKRRRTFSEHHMTEPNRLNRMYRLRDLPQFVGLRRTQIGELIKLGKFPRPVSLSDGGRAVAWLEHDLIAWQTDRIAARNAEVVGDAAHAPEAA
jgi:prophage regulatory protein